MNQKVTLDECMSLNAAAKLFGKSYQSVYRYVKKGVLASHAIGNQTVVSNKDVCDFLANYKPGRPGRPRKAVKS